MTTNGGCSGRNDRQVPSAAPRGLRGRRKFRGGPIVAVLIVGATVVAGCSGSDSSTPNAASSSGTSTSSASAAAGAVTLTAKPYGTAPDMTPVDEATAAEWKQQVTEALASPEEKGTTGAWVAISLPGRGLWTASFGTTSKDGPAASLTDHSRIGSITKTLTATAVLEQVAAGTLSLDDTVEKVLPDLATRFPATAKLTVQQLLAMSSGLPDYANVKGGAFTQAAKDPSKVWTPEDLIASALDASEPTKPGTPGYTTTGYAILGMMLEKVTGDPADQVITAVAKEAGLTQTVLTAPDDNTMPEPYAHGYQDEAGTADLQSLGVDLPVGTDFTDVNVSSLGGAGGGAYSTVGDLFNWAASGVGTSLLSTDMAKQRTELSTDIPGLGKYGLGIMAQPFGPDWVGHSGQALGYEAMAMHNPKTGATVAILVNSTDGLNAVLTALATDLANQ